LTERLVVCFHDRRSRELIEHSVETLVAQHDAERLPQQQGFTLRCDRPTIRASHNFATADGCESGLPYTLSASGRFLG
jgi:hypothetical protein